MILTDSIEIKAPPNKVFSFFTGIKDDESYKAWHPDHVVFALNADDAHPLGNYKCATL